MTRTAVFIFLCSALLVTGLHRLNDPHHRHNQTAHDDYDDAAATKRVASFFKLAHSRVTLDSDLRATAAGLVPLYAELCASVRDCYANIMELLNDHRTELRLAADRMDRLHLVLNRVRRLVHDGEGGKGKKRRPSHKGLRRKEERTV